MFTEEVLLILKNNGWYPERKVSASTWVVELQKEGYTMSPESILLLENFGGLHIPPLKSASGISIPSMIHFDPTNSFGLCERHQLYEKAINMKLSPIGWTSDNATLLLADEGKLFADSHSGLFLLGQSFEDAMENTLIIPKRDPHLQVYLANWRNAKS